MTKNILITGLPGSGKSTLIESVVKRLRKPCTGFVTREIRESGKRTGFRIVTLGGRQGVLAHLDLKSKVHVGKYGVGTYDLDVIAVPSIIPKYPDEIIVVDEIGKMECLSPLFRETVNRALDSPNVVLASITLKASGFMERIKKREDITLITISPENRDLIADELTDYLNNA